MLGCLLGSERDGDKRRKKMPYIGVELRTFLGF